MNYKKIFKRETKVIAYVVICLTVLVIGTSYALFLQVDNNTNNQVVEAGSLTVTYSGGNTITVAESDSNCLTPQSDANGSGSGGCKFNLSITNTGTLPMQYNLLIYDNSTDAPSGATLVNHSVIRHSLKKQYTVAGKNETATEAAALSSLSKYNSTNKRILEAASIDAGETITFALNIWIDESASTDIIGQYVYLKLDVKGSVDESKAKKVICKRATTLHTSGETTYGNLGTTGTLTTGDAFDCDVNGDKMYNSDTERFYYVSDYYDTETNKFDTSYAALVYYSNVLGGLPNNTAISAYGSNNIDGPTDARKQLPTTSQWSNVSLINPIRAIKNESGGTTTAAGNLTYSFSYEGYAARLLTSQEIQCGDIRSSCDFLFENTNYKSSEPNSVGYWLETPYSGDDYHAYSINGGMIDLYSSVSTSIFGVRPVIEVAKSAMDY